MRVGRRRLGALAGVLTIAVAGSDGSPARAPWLDGAGLAASLLEAPHDVRRERLCRQPSGQPSAREAVRIACQIERVTPRAPAPAPPEALTVAAFNIERGYETDAQIQAFRAGRGLPPADVLLLSEVDRGCSRTGYRDVPREYAAALGMHAAFGVEYVELPRPWGPGRRIEAPCEHGNAILSRFPLDDVELLRFEANESWYRDPARAREAGEPRLGGRMALGATLRIGERRLRVFSTHLESGAFDAAYRRAQADELARAIERGPRPVVVGGDFNVHTFAVDLLLGQRRDAGVARLERAGLRDAHAGLSLLARPTHSALLVLDLILSDLEVRAAGVAQGGAWRGLSDHRPVWTRLALPR
jgi:endonuclease/exonuclease/phosphatase family metal-dependent hydrolase